MEQAKLQEWKQLLLSEIGDLQARIAPLESELRVKQEKLAAIDRLLDLEANPLETIPLSTGIGPRAAMNSRKPADVAYDVLKGVATPMYYKDLCQAIMQTGFVIRGKDPATNLIAHIAGDPRFERVKRGTYALKEWKIKKPRGRKGRRRGG